MRATHSSYSDNSSYSKTRHSLIPTNQLHYIHTQTHVCVHTCLVARFWRRLGAGLQQGLSTVLGSFLHKDVSSFTRLEVLVGVD